MTVATSFDVIIIGAGIAGIGCAAMLDENLSVLVLEREAHCGYHATGRSAAIYIPSYGGACIRELSRLSKSYFTSPPPESGIQNFLQPRGELVLATAEEDEAMSSLLAEAKSLTEISIKHAMHMVPILDPEYISRIAYDAGAQDIDVDLLLQHWRKRFLNLNVRNKLITDQTVEKLKRKDDQWHIDTQSARYVCDIVVNAAGAWADSIAINAGLSPLGLTPCRRSAALTPAPREHQISDWPAFASVSETWYAKPTAGKLMISPADEDPVSAHDAYPEDITIATGIDRYERAVTVEVESIEHTWAGLRTFAADRTPVAGFDRNAKGFFWLAGQGGYGIQTAPALSQFAANLVSGTTLEPDLQNLASQLCPSRLEMS